ncbi:uncharacterized protein LOC106650641 [Trichogramma pretiosum]|uniref:uncharacterized protein LOC106650641 n=1 Tax=Trichogramma pretiosum TaxID=7493 RepID=UPI0006C963A1|nr:uncharacterized protein LOC106650641 [Trichogramma pretiosum]
MSEITAAALIIPKFNGDFENWIEFRDKFAELVDGDSGLSGVQKFTFLEYSLTGGPAAQLIDSLEISGANYATLWKRVGDEYGDPSEARRYHVAKLFDSERLREDDCSAGDLRRLIDEFAGRVAALKRLQVPTETWDPLLVHLLSSKLPPRIEKRWKLKFFLSSRAEKLTEMIEFLEGEYKYLKRRDGKKDLNRRVDDMEVQRFAAEGVNHCPVCCYGNQGNWDKCKTFCEISCPGRVKLVNELEYCLNSLAPKHREIFDKYREENHDHELLRLSKLQLKAVDIKDNRADGFSNFQTHYPLRATVRAYAEDTEGKSRSFRAFLGTGDELNLMSKKLCDLLGHPLHPPSKKFSKLTNILEEKKRAILGYTEVKVKSRVGNFESSMWFVVVDELDCKEYPEPSLRLGDISIPRVVTLADPHFDRPEPVDVVFGATSFGGLLEQGHADTGDPDQPIWQETVFGWIAAGNVRVIDNDSPKIEWEYLKNPKSSDRQETFFKKCKRILDIDRGRNEQKMTI